MDSLITVITNLDGKVLNYIYVMYYLYLLDMWVEKRRR